MKISGTFYVFSDGTNWLCNRTDSSLVRLMAYLLSFSDFDSGRISVNAGMLNAASQDLCLGEEEIKGALSVLATEVLFPAYGLYREDDHDPRYVLLENEFFVHPNYFWHGSYDGRKRFMRWFAEDVSCKRNNYLRRSGEKETKWLIVPIDEEYRNQLEEDYRKKKLTEEKKRIAAEKRAAKKTERESAKENLSKDSKMV